MKKLRPYLQFYYSKFFISLALGLFVILRYQIPKLAYKGFFLASLLVWMYHHFVNDRKKQSLYFYFNLGISELKLYLFTLFLNLAVLIIVNLLVWIF